MKTITRVISLMLVVGLIPSLAAVEARAALVLEVDPGAMTYRLTGSQTLVPFFGDESDFAQWANSSGSILPLTALDNTIATSTADPLVLTRLRLGTNAADLILDWGVNSVGEQTVVGNGVAHSYAAATTAQKDYLQGIIGQTLDPIILLDADPVAVVGFPEPALGPLILVGATAMCASRRRAC